MIPQCWNGCHHVSCEDCYSWRRPLKTIHGFALCIDIRMLAPTSVKHHSDSSDITHTLPGRFRHMYVFRYAQVCVCVFIYTFHHSIRREFADIWDPGMGCLYIEGMGYWHCRRLVLAQFWWGVFCFPDLRVASMQTFKGMPLVQLMLLIACAVEVRTCPMFGHSGPIRGPASWLWTF